MKTIGLLGGMSWVSTQLYYALLNKATAERRGPGYQPPILLKSFDYQALFDLQLVGREDEVGSLLAQGAVDLQSIGANGIAICANTMHRHFDQVQSAVQIPVLHVADATAYAIKAAGFKSAGLLGTRMTMEGSFYSSRFLEDFGIGIQIPSDSSRVEVERVIRTELTRDIVSDDSRQLYIEVISELANAGSECVILGCTEIGLLINQTHTGVPVFDTTILHAQALVDWALA